MKCYANIYFNWQFLTKIVIPKYANIKIPCTSPATNVTQEKIQTIRLKDEIKFLYKQKEKLNNDLYRIHLKAAQERGSTWHVSLDSIHESINQEWEKKYKTIEEKLKKLVHTQTKKNPTTKETFNLWVINKNWHNLYQGRIDIT